MTRSAPGPDGFAIRPADRADLLAVLRIERASFPQPWPYDAFEGFLGQPGFLVAVDADESVAGYVVADVSATHSGNLGHVKDIAVRPDRRGEGLGTSLLSRAFVVLGDYGATSVTLEVRESNERARRLYRRIGFEPLRRASRYYEDGEDAIVMVRELER